MYLAKFDENGNRKETYIAAEYTEEQKAEMYAAGFVDLSEEDWNYYVGNHGTGDNGTGYIRDNVTGKPVSAPPPAAPSKDQRIAKLDARYAADKTAIMEYYLEAIATGNNDLAAELTAELKTLNTNYDAEMEALINE